MATWSLIAYLLYMCYQHFFILGFEHFEIHNFFSISAYFLPAIFLGAQITLWHFFYRKSDAAGKIFAFVAGLFILFKYVIVPLLVSDVHTKDINSTHVLASLYIALSHLVYSLLYKVENSYIKFI